MKKFDINEVYENINEAIMEGEISHNDFFDMVRDFCKDTIFLKTELELDEKSVMDLENICKALEIAMRNKGLNKTY